MREGETLYINTELDLVYGFWINTWRPRQDGRHFPDDILKYIFLNENVWISLTISMKCVRKGSN